MNLNKVKNAFKYEMNTFSMGKDLTDATELQRI